MSSGAQWRAAAAAAAAVAAAAAATAEAAASASSLPAARPAAVLILGHMNFWTAQKSAVKIY